MPVDPNTGFPILGQSDLSPVNPYIPDPVVPGGFIRTPASQLTPDPRPGTATLPPGWNPDFSNGDNAARQGASNIFNSGVNAAIAGEGLLAVADGIDRALAGGGGSPTGGSGSSGSSGGGGAGAPAAAPVDPLQAIRDLFKQQLDERLEGVRQQYQPLIRGLNQVAKQSRRQVNADGRATRQNMRENAQRTDERQATQDAARALGDAEIDGMVPAGQEGALAQIRATGDNRIQEIRAMGEEQSQFSRETSRLIQQQARGTITSNRQSAMTQIRTERAAARAAARDAYNDSMIQLALGQQQMAAAGGGGGGGGGGGSRRSGGSSGSSGDTDDQLMFEYLVSEMQMAPDAARLLLATGGADNLINTQFELPEPLDPFYAASGVLGQIQVGVPGWEMPEGWNETAIQNALAQGTITPSQIITAGGGNPAHLQGTPENTQASGTAQAIRDLF